MSKAKEPRHHCLYHLSVHFGPAFLLHQHATSGYPFRDEGVDLGRHALPNIPSGTLWECCGQSAQYGLHHAEQVSAWEEIRIRV